MRPVLRSGHDIIHLEKGESVIGSLTYGIGQAIRDPDSKIMELNVILDGTRGWGECVSAVSRICDVNEHEANEFLKALVRRGHIVDDSLPTSLTDLQKERYSRSSYLLNWICTDDAMNQWVFQERLIQSRVVVLGVGGIGGAIAAHMVASGVGSVHMVDFDEVELSNLNRQYLFVEDSIGEPKVKVAADRLRLMNSECKITFADRAIESAADIRAEIEGADLFFRAADSPDQLPFWASDAALSSNTAWIDCSYAGPVVNCCTFVPGVTGCYRCVREWERSKRQASGTLGGFSDSPPPLNAALGPIVHVAASLAAYEGVRFLCGLSPQTIGRAVHQNMFRYDHSYVVDVPNECRHAHG